MLPRAERRGVLFGVDVVGAFRFLLLFEVVGGFRGFVSLGACLESGLDSLGAGGRLAGFPAVSLVLVFLLWAFLGGMVVDANGKVKRREAHPCVMLGGS